MWIDATSAAGYIYNPKESQVADKIAFAPAPIEVTSNGSAWFWAWALGIPSSSKKVDAAKIVRQVGDLEGLCASWSARPRVGSRHRPGRASRPMTTPSTRRRRRSRSSCYQAMADADITKPTKDPVPYTGIQYVAIPEFQGIGTTVGQQIASALAGQVKVDQALETSQSAVERVMKQAHYMK